MKTVPLVLSLLAATAMPVMASGYDPQQETNLKPITAEKPAAQPIRGRQAMQLLALETNLTPQQVRMVEYTVAAKKEYRFIAHRKVAKQFEESLGSERYSTWASGRPIALYSPAVLEAARSMAAASGRGHDQQPVLVAIDR